MIDIDKEKLIPIRKSGKLFPGNPHASTVYRWIKAGMNGCFLETSMVGGRRFTSQEAVKRFIVKLTQKADGRYNREFEFSKEELEQMGSPRDDNLWSGNFGEIELPIE
ncbi:MAG: DUF1580 domain-containing protein [Planctomycetia bacterium]|nr:DUF1580 domain-containing protein [Planctomycetia bacterium]